MQKRIVFCVTYRAYLWFTVCAQLVDSAIVINNLYYTGWAKNGATDS